MQGSITGLAVGDFVRGGPAQALHRGLTLKIGYQESVLWSSR